ncbi:MAG: AAA family ATPase [Micromonosporaceae bacterium]|nr:AAA family ATPase [Micromonosporaceae bacterium]
MPRPRVAAILVPVSSAGFGRGVVPLSTGAADHARPVLLGRVTEQAAIDSLLELARAGQGGGLVLHGEPGIGKTALLEYAAGRADGMRVLDTAGVEPEADLSYAALHRLLLPVLDRLGRIPGPQARGVEVVFGRRSGPAPEPFLVALATLSLLAQVARDRPVLCLVDDAHWADPASLDALTVSARRFATEPIALVLAARPDAARPVDPVGLFDLPLGGLDRAATRVLLAGQSRRRRSVAEQAALLAMTGGNPLAIRELAATGWRGAVVHEPMPLPAGQRRAFLDRVPELDPAARQVLLLAAVAGAAPVDTIRRAAHLLGVDVTTSVASGELDDLIVADGAALSFRHPLVRSAVYHAASPTTRRAAHRALAAALAAPPAGDPDRRAWHLGQAVDGPDEPVAAALEHSGERARRGTGPAAAAVYLERAGELSASRPSRARRLVAAAAAWWEAGDPDRAGELLARAERVDPARRNLRPEIATLQAQVAVRAGRPGLPADAVTLLLPVVTDLLRTGGLRHGAGPLLLFGEASGHAGAVDAWSTVTGMIESLPPPGPGTGDVLTRLYRAAGRVPTGAEPGLAPGDLAAIEALTDPAELCWAGGLLHDLGDPVRARRLRRRAVARARAVSATGTLAWTLCDLAADELGCGRFAIAEGYATEGLRLAQETGQPYVAYQHQSTLALLAAWRGREHDARELADTVLAGAAHRLAGATTTAYRALAVLELAARRPAEALAHLSAIDRGDPPTHPQTALRPVPELVEAAVRAGRPDQATRPLKQFAIWADTSGAPDLLALAARSRALLETAETAETAPAGAAELQFRQALARHAQTDAPLEQARTELLFGEHLRRARRRFDARPHLRAAFETFRRLRAPVWADRAQAELRAAGEREPRRAQEQPPQSRTRAVLTPQEQRIAAAVSEGATNREIATRLFLSPRTVDYHLRKIFQKAGLSSRTELIRLALTGRGP